MHNPKKVDRHFIKTPIYVVSSMVGALRQYLSTENRLTTDYSSYLWDPEPSKTKVKIVEDSNTSTESLGQYPLVSVSLPQIVYEQSVMSDMMDFLPSEGSLRILEINKAQMRFRCISISHLASMELATEIKYFISVFRHQLEHDLCLDKIRQSGFSGPQRVEEYKEYWTTDVTCDILYQENWGVAIEHLKVKTINLDLKAK